MRTPTRKPGKYTHLKPDPYLTKEKIRELKDRLERMKKIQPKLAAEVKRLASDGDFSENAAYQIAKGRLRGLNQKVIDTENHLKSAIVITHKNNKSIVQIGSTVEVEIEGKQKTFTILGSSETNPTGGIISRNSPIGSSILNKKIGDIVKVKLKNKEVEYKIKKIR
jgi:transcription elongation GreA/GreB family factor